MPPARTDGLVGDAQRRRPRVVRRDWSLTSTPTSRTGRPRRGEVAVRGEGQVGVAAAEVDEPQRVLGRRVRSCPAASRVVEGRVQRPKELLDLAVLGLAARLDPAVLVGDTEGAQHRVVLGQQPLLAPVVAWRCRRRSARRRGRRGVQQRLALLRHPQLVGARVGGLDVPVAEGLGQQRVDRARRRPRRGGSAVNACVAS